MRTDYLEQMSAHVDEGGRLSHQNAVDLLAEVTALCAHVETLEKALECVVAFGKINLSSEWEQGLCDIIRSMAYCATAALQSSQGETSSPSVFQAPQNNAERLPIDKAGVGGETNLTDWKQDQAETSRLPRTSSDGGVAPGETVADKRSSADASASSGDSVAAGVLPGPSDHFHRASFTAALDGVGAWLVFQRNQFERTPWRAAPEVKKYIATLRVWENAVRSITPPQGAAGDGAQAALKQIIAVCDDNSGTTVRHDIALRFVRDVAKRALQTERAADQPAPQPSPAAGGK